MTYSKKEHNAVRDIKDKVWVLHNVLGRTASRADNPPVKVALNDARDALDCWLQEYINNGVLNIIEGMEEEAGIPEYEREQREIQSYRRE
jgi:hypothetical protein